MKPWESPTTSLRVAAVLAAAVGVLVFANSLGNDFAYDDRLIIQENVEIQSLETLPGTFFKPYWPNKYGKELGLWRPVTTWVYGLQWAVWGGAPVGFHLFNVLLNGLAAGLVVLLIGAFLPVPAALAGGLIFAVHPVHVEAVANVVGMAELLSAVFYLLACLVIARAPGRMKGRSLALALGLFIVAILTKESAVTLPGVVLLLDSARGDLRLKDLRGYLSLRWPLYAGLVLATGAMLWGRWTVLGSVADPFAPMGAEILAEGDVPRIWTVLATWPEIFRLLFYPAELSSDYTPEVISIAYGWTVQNVLGLVLGVGALILAAASWRSGPLSTERLAARALGFGIVWFVITVSPTSNFFFLTGVLLAERTLFLPSVGFAMGVGWMVARLRQERPRFAVAAVLVAITAMGYRTVLRNPTWKDNLTVFDTMVAEHPESGRAQWVMGDLHFKKGEFAHGMAAYRRAIGMVGSHYTLLSEIGRRLVAEEFDQVGEYVLRHAWRDRPEFGLAPSLLAVLYDRQERWVLAEEASRAAIERDSTSAVQSHILSRALAAQGRFDEAVEARMAVIRLGEDRWEQWRWLSELELQRGDTVQALTHLETARTRVRSPADLAAVDSTKAALLVGISERVGAPQ